MKHLKILSLLAIFQLGCGPVPVEVSGDVIVTHTVDDRTMYSFFLVECQGDSTCTEEMMDRFSSHAFGE